MGPDIRRGQGLPEGRLPRSGEQHEVNIIPFPLTLTLSLPLHCSKRLIMTVLCNNVTREYNVAAQDNIGETGLDTYIQRIVEHLEKSEVGYLKLKQRFRTSLKLVQVTVSAILTREIRSSTFA